MLACKNRLKSQATIQNILAKGRWVSSQTFTLKYQINAQDGEVEIAILISKKIEPRATQRNRLKRQIAAVCHESMTNFRPGLQMIIIPRISVTSFSFASMAAALKSLFKKIDSA